MQLTARRGAAPLAVAALLAIAAPVGSARADGTVTMRGAYYKERSTRVVQPMLDGSFQAGERGTVEAHLLIDAITSASASAGAADGAFTERRYEGGAGYSHEPWWGKLRGEFRVSREPDYFSVFGSAGVERALAEDNTIVSVAAGVGEDWVDNAGAQGPFAAAIEGTLRTFLGAASVSQVVSRRALVSVGYDLSHLRGYQQNPYRSVNVGTNTFSERHPDTRTRHAIALTGKAFVAATATTFIATYRLYLDSWGVLASTPELRAVQPVSESLELALRYRYHVQGAADFFDDSYAVEQRYLSDDEKLSAFHSHTVELKLAMLGQLLGLDDELAEARGEVLLQYIAQNNRFGDAVAAQLALTLPFSY